MAPRYDVEHTTYGLDAFALRPLPDGSTYLRTTTWIAPFVSIVPGSGGPHVVFIASPIDDTHHNLFYGSFSDEEIHDGVHQPGFMDTISGDRPYDPFNLGGFTGSRDDNYGQDRDAMRRGHFSGFTGNLLQEDMVTQASMGPIVDRTKEHLSTGDVAVIQARRLLLRPSTTWRPAGPWSVPVPAWTTATRSQLIPSSPRRTRPTPRCPPEPTVERVRAAS